MEKVIRVLAIVGALAIAIGIYILTRGRVRVAASDVRAALGSHDERDRQAREYDRKLQEINERAKQHDSDAATLDERSERELERARQQVEASREFLQRLRERRERKDVP